LASYNCPALSILLDTSLRANEGGRFLDLITTTVQYDAPLGPESFEQRVISPVRLDIELDACKSVIAERRLLLQKQLERQRRTFELAKAEQAEARLQETLRHAADH